MSQCTNIKIFPGSFRCPRNYKSLIRGKYIGKYDEFESKDTESSNLLVRYSIPSLTIGNRLPESTACSSSFWPLRRRDTGTSILITAGDRRFYTRAHYTENSIVKVKLVEDFFHDTPAAC